MCFQLFSVFLQRNNKDAAFDQRRVDKDNHHYLRVEDTVFDSADEEMQPIFHRLMMAASNVEMRQDMSVITSILAE